MLYGDIVMVLSIVLRIIRTLDGVEIDKIISDVETEKALAAEHRWRADWCKAELAAKSFSADVLEPAMPRPSELRLRGLFCVYPTVSFAPSISAGTCTSTLQ